MHALSLWEPYASLIADGLKTIETRTWKPSRALVGQRIAIHAAKTKQGIKQIDPELDTEIADYLESRTEEFPFGHIVCTAQYVGAVLIPPEGFHRLADALKWRRDSADWQYLLANKPYGNYGPNRYLWYLHDVHKVVPPVPATGKQGLWTFGPTLQLASL